MVAPPGISTQLAAKSAALADDSFNGSSKGTDSYWKRKKIELNEWMLYHIEKGHGPPTLFIKN